MLETVHMLKQSYEDMDENEQLWKKKDFKAEVGILFSPRIHVKNKKIHNIKKLNIRVSCKRKTQAREGGCCGDK